MAKPIALLFRSLRRRLWAVRAAIDDQVNAFSCFLSHPSFTRCLLVMQALDQNSENNSEFRVGLARTHLLVWILIEAQITTSQHFSHSKSLHPSPPPFVQVSRPTEADVLDPTTPVCKSIIASCKASLSPSARFGNKTSCTVHLSSAFYAG